MLPINYGGRAAYQHFVLMQINTYYPNPQSLARSTGDILEHFWSLDLFVEKNLIDKTHLSLSGDAPCPSQMWLLLSGALF